MIGILNFLIFLIYLFVFHVRVPPNPQLLGRIRLDGKGIYSVDFAAGGRRLAVGGSHDQIALRDIQDV